LKESRAVPWCRTYGPASNGQLFERWIFVTSFSLLILYALANPDFAMAGKNLILSTQIIPPMSLLTGIVLVFLGGWLKRNKKSKKGYRVLSAVGGVFMILSAVLSAGGVSGYKLLCNLFLLLSPVWFCLLKHFSFGALAPAVEERRWFRQR
jgi:drug/metabolite transporter superfamily protein YnfA